MAAEPVLIPDYVFMWAFLFSFVGSIFYGISSLLSMDPQTIIVNNNVRMAINVIIGCSGIISMFVWFNMEIPALNKTILNPKVVKKNVNA